MYIQEVNEKYIQHFGLKPQRYSPGHRTPGANTVDISIKEMRREGGNGIELASESAV
jgi:hypothetical protein